MAFFQYLNFDGVDLPLPDGYEVESLQLKPMLLKNPCKKCTNYEMNKTIVIETLLAPSGLSIKDIVE